jgi:uncharacterized protein YyaL (SSP411 family)
MAGPGPRRREGRPGPIRAAVLGLISVLVVVQVSAYPGVGEAPGTTAPLQPPPAATDQPLRANALAGNPSPYLAMHGADSVDWRPWGPEVLADARARNLPIFISSGYFACHWCHVMQRESWHDPGIAEVLNRHFIPVKLDRELHPALDSYLIDFTQRTAGRAGWPLNVVLTPEGYPLTGFTYEPPERLAGLLGRLVGLWETRADELGRLARSEAEALAAGQSETRPQPPEAQVGPEAVAARLVTEALAWADRLAGGFGHQSRFPMAPNLAVLLELQGLAPSAGPDSELGPFLRLTLDQMTRLALRDHLGGGFFRYTVDPDWRTPHFEKMLYDQALLIPVLLRGAEVLGEPRYRFAARETLDFLLAQMRRPDGAFMASLSAVDGAGEEGGYYLWRPEDLARLLSPEALRLAALAWGLDAAPEHAAGSLPVTAMDPAKAAADLRLDPESAAGLLDQARASLLAERGGRSLPADTKALAAWNGLTLSALVAGARAFPGGPYRAAAEALRGILVERLWDGEDLHRARSDQGWIGEATLEDYAYVARGLRDWADLAGSEADRALAQRLVRLAWARFHGDTGWRLSAAPLLPGVTAEPALADGPLPSPAAVIMGLSLADRDPALAERARAAQGAAAAVVAARPFEFASEAWLLIRHPLPGPEGRRAQ